MSESRVARDLAQAFDHIANEFQAEPTP